MKKIILTGGGTAGHITPNLALIPSLLEHGFEIHYIGSYEGMEKRLVADYNIPYYGIDTAKLKRSFDFSNFTIPKHVLKGISESKKLIKQIKPDIVFSKGGYVSLPVINAAASLKVPCILHESDITPGLANKRTIKHAAKVCCNFPETLLMLPPDKAVLTGSPIRESLFKGNKIAALDLCGFTANKPVILVTGGSQGSAAINKAIREALPKLLADFQIVHLCGKDKTDNLLLNTRGYKQFEYLKTELKDILAMADLAVSRAGANAICEFLALRKPNLLIPLPTKSSRGDQIQNAKSFETQGFSIVINEEDLDETLLIDKINELYFNSQTYVYNMRQSPQFNSIGLVVDLIEKMIADNVS